MRHPQTSSVKNKEKNVTFRAVTVGTLIEGQPLPPTNCRTRPNTSSLVFLVPATAALSSGSSIASSRSEFEISDVPWSVRWGASLLHEEQLSRGLCEIGCAVPAYWRQHNGGSIEQFTGQLQASMLSLVEGFVQRSSSPGSAADHSCGSISGNLVDTERLFKGRLCEGSEEDHCSRDPGDFSTADYGCGGQCIRPNHKTHIAGHQGLLLASVSGTALNLPALSTNFNFGNSERKGTSTKAAQSRGNDELRAVFDEIDENQDGRLTEDELRSYAARKGLPTTYVRDFLDQARYGWKEVSLPWEDQDSMGFATTYSSSTKHVAGFFGKQGGFKFPFRIKPFIVADNTVDFRVFRDFIAAKDGAMRHSFNQIDLDGDGLITIGDLERGVQRVRVMCSRTGRYCPVKRNCVARMMRKMQRRRGDSVTFEEFRDFFTLLPSSEYLLDYWLDASCCASGLDLGSNVQVLTRTGEATTSRSMKGSPWNHLLAGGLAGAVSRTATAPLETLRLSMMVSPAKSLLAASQKIMHQSGWRAFFKGNLTNVVRSAPQKAIDFFAFEAYKDFFRRSGGKAGSWQVVASGALAGATSTMILYPLDVVRSRLTVQTGQQYKGILDALVEIPRKEGFFALYRGLRPSILSILPEAAITYGCFDVLKSTYKRVMQEEEIGVVPALVCGVTSAFTGQLVAYPLELVARRSQMGGGAAYKSMGDALRQIVAKEGIAGLYRGIVPASMKVIPMAIVSFGVYESTKQILVWASDWEARRELESQALEEERRARTVTLKICSKRDTEMAIGGCGADSST